MIQTVEQEVNCNSDSCAFLVVCVAMRFVCIVLVVDTCSYSCVLASMVLKYFFMVFLCCSGIYQWSNSTIKLVTRQQWTVSTGTISHSVQMIVTPKVKVCGS